MNTLMSILKLVYVGTTYNSVGRSGEAAYSCFDNGSYWDSDDEKFYFSQKEMKVGDEKKKTSYPSQSPTYSINTGCSLSTI